MLGFLLSLRYVYVVLMLCRHSYLSLGYVYIKSMLCRHCLPCPGCVNVGYLYKLFLIQKFSLLYG